MGWGQSRAAVVEPRSNVIAMRRRDGSSPSVQPVLFDQAKLADDLPPLDRTDREVIASLLHVSRAHLPSPKAVDAAIEKLIGRRRP